MPERIRWTLAAWDDYLYWQRQDRKTLKRISRLIADAVDRIEASALEDDYVRPDPKIV